ncbi:MAG: putative flap endonuclease-1-like 5' DNA nuclease [Paraglaciecola sp.]|jgi:predicted flap endonuclease-1-like 5' DNA nuclease
MAKKIQNTSKKKVKSDKSKGDSILEEINAKLKSSQKDLQKQVDHLTSQVKTLSKEPGKTARKLLKTIEKEYHKKVAQLQNDLDKRMVSVMKVQDKVIAQLPTELAEKLHLKASSAAKTPKTTAVKVKKQAAAKPKIAPKAPKKPTMISINGIGPVTLKKLTEAGITSLDDLANTPKSKTEALKQFEKTKGFSNWKKEAQALLDKK